MKKSLKRMLAAAMTATLTLTALMGCGSEAARETSTGQGATGSGETAMGRYLEEEISLPAGLTHLLDLGNLTDGTLRVVGEMTLSGAIVWESKDAGDTWEKVFDFMLEEEDQYMAGASLSPTGESVYTIMTIYSDHSVGGYSYKFADAQGNVRDLDVGLPGSDQNIGTMTQSQTTITDENQAEDGASAGTEESLPMTEQETVKAESDTSMDANDISHIHFSQDGELYAYGGIDQGIYHLDKETGDILETFSVDDSVRDFTIIGEQLVVAVKNGIERYDLDSGESKTKDENLEEQLSSFALEYNTDGSYPVLMQQGTDQNSIYFCNSSGFFRHVMEGSLSEQIIDGALTSLGIPSVSLLGMALLANDTYMIGVSDEGEHKILRYTYSADTPSKPSQEITVYSLTSQLEIRQAISTYMKEHPDTLVNLEIGMTGEDAVTVSDALKTLNTNIAAGKGPDILVLDGMPIATYIEKGLLVDLSELADEIAESDGLYENITNVYKTGDGLYAIPARFAIPAIQGDTDTLNQISDISSLADQAVKLREENPDIQYIIDTSNQESFLETLYSYYSASLMADGKMDQEKVAEFYGQAKRIYDTGTESEEDSTNIGSSPGTSQSFEGAMSLLEGMSKINAGAITSLEGFSFALAAAKKMDNISYKLVNADGGNVFIPKAVLGINSKTQKMDEAKSFITFLLSREAQVISQGSGLPVTRAGMEALKEKEKEVVQYRTYGTMYEDGSMLTVNGSWPTEEMDALLKGIEELYTMGLDDNTVFEIFKEQGIQCLEGTISAEEAAANLIQKVNLYLAE